MVPEANFSTTSGPSTKTGNAVRTQEGLSHWFEITSGVRHGCTVIRVVYLIIEGHQKRLTLRMKMDNLRNTKQPKQHEQHDMMMSTGKTEAMKVCRRPSDLNINWNKWVSSSMSEAFTQEGTLDLETETKAQKPNNVSNQLAPLLRHLNIQVETKPKLLDSSFSPISHTNVKSGSWIHSSK